MTLHSKKIIWVRHAEKSYNNGKAPRGEKQHDPGIRNDIHPINSLVDELVEKHGPPDKIIISPFLRTRQTANVIKKRLQIRHNKIPSIETNTLIREYLGFCRDKNSYADIDSETEKYLGGPIKIEESIDSLHYRVKSHIDSLSTIEDNIWVITHGIVMSTVYSILTSEEPERPKPLDYIIYNNSEISKNF
jgi:broad specificity phosphatase PhoE